MPLSNKNILSIESLEYVQKNLEATLLFINFSKAFDSIYRGKMEQIRLAYCLPKETIPMIMILYKNMKAMVHSLYGDIDFNIVVLVL